MKAVVVVDLGTGNLRSVAKAVEHVAPEREVVISHDPAIIEQAERVVLPGQGAIGTWMTQMQQEHLHGALTKVMASRPVLGICVGMQALFDQSEEDGGTASFGIIPGQVKRFPDNMTEDGVALKIPQMGWNQVWQQPMIGLENDKVHPCWQGIESGERFYFANSYCGYAEDRQHIAGECHYGVNFTAAVAKDQLFAVQFHPEKSQNAGLRLIKNFINWQP